MSYKDLDQSTDISVQTSVINEIIPLTGAFFSGTGYYLKNYINITSGSQVSGGFFATIYDGSPTSISSSALVDMTYGFSPQSLNAQSVSTFLVNEKQRVYQQMARYLLGSVNNLFSFNNVVQNDLFFMLFKRRIFKDEIAKGTFAMNIQMDAFAGDTLTLQDTGAAGSFATGLGGDVAPLFSGAIPVGAIFYDAGVVAIATGAFLPAGSISNVYWSGSRNLNQMLSGNIDQMMDGFRNKINNVQFQNQTNLHSSVIFCRALNGEFNYSTNPTFVDNSGRIIPTSGTDNQTRTYITTIGLYDINKTLMAVAKLSQPVKKAPDSEITIRCKLSY